MAQKAGVTTWIESRGNWNMRNGLKVWFISAYLENSHEHSFYWFIQICIKNYYFFSPFFVTIHRMGWSILAMWVPFYSLHLTLTLLFAPDFILFPCFAFFNTLAYCAALALLFHPRWLLRAVNLLPQFSCIKCCTLFLLLRIRCCAWSKQMQMFKKVKTFLSLFGSDLWQARHEADSIRIRFVTVI